jgi:hypothetical protein
LASALSAAAKSSGAHSGAPAAFASATADSAAASSFVGGGLHSLLDKAMQQLARENLAK